MDFVLKQRLVGAVVLVALAVIFIPMLLESPDSDLVPQMEPLPIPQDQGLNRPLEEIPQTGAIPDTPAESTLDTPTSDRSGEDAGGSEEGSAIPLPLPQPTAPVDDVPAEAADMPPQASPGTDAGADGAPAKDATASAPAPAASGALGSWVVQVGSFSSEQNALRLRDRLRKAKFVTQVEKVNVDGKTHYRVRVGPYLERGEAEQEQKKLANAFDLKGRVLSYP